MGLMDELRQMVADEQLRQQRLREHRVAMQFRYADGRVEMRDGDHEELAEHDLLVVVSFDEPDPNVLAELNRRIAERAAGATPEPRSLSKSPRAPGGATTPDRRPRPARRG